MNAPSVDIKEMLEYFAQDSSSSDCDIDLFPIFIGKEPAEPQNVISIFETGIMGPQLTLDRKEVYEYPTIQIRVRANEYLEGWDVITNIKNILHGRANETWNGALYTLIRCSSGPALLDYDKNQRVRFIINFYLQRR